MRLAKAYICEFQTGSSIFTEPSYVFRILRKQKANERWNECSIAAGAQNEQLSPGRVEPA